MGHRQRRRSGHRVVDAADIVIVDVTGTSLLAARDMRRSVAAAHRPARSPWSGREQCHRPDGSGRWTTSVAHRGHRGGRPAAHADDPTSGAGGRGRDAGRLDRCPGRRRGHLRRRVRDAPRPDVQGSSCCTSRATPGLYSAGTAAQGRVGLTTSEEPARWTSTFTPGETHRLHVIAMRNVGYKAVDFDNEPARAARSGH